MRSAGVVIQRPGSDLLSSMAEAEEQAFVQQFVAHPPVEGFHKPVLGRLARRDVVPVDAMILRPGQDGGGRELRAVVADDHGRAAPPSDQRGQLTRDAASRDRGVGDRRQALRAMEAPLREIVANAGEEPSVVLNRVVEGSGAFGYNAANGEYGDMIEFGILDPTKVTRTALQNAASIAGLMITTEAMVAEAPKKDEPAMPGGGGGMGGMGGMDF